MTPHMRRGLVVAALALLALPASAQADRYSLANGCYALQSQSAGKLVVKDGSGGYAATAASPGTAEPFRMKATALGHYLFFGRQSGFMAAPPRGEGPAQPHPDDAANRPVDDARP